MSKEFRGDIQGLRALAVLTVIAAHAGVPFVAGGYIGVDVFFVISGYLISGLLFREIMSDGRFSLTQFWSRRARRILPAATLVTTVTVGLSLLWMNVIDARMVVIDAAWASVFAANVRFSQQDIYYFAQTDTTSPLQHYWSLAVEEQFYVVWPLLLLACLGAARLVTGRRKQQRLPRRAVLAMLVLLTVASFAWSVVQTAEQPGSAYFSTLTRGWELGVGALAALIPAAALRRLTNRTASLMSLAGLTAVVVACVVLTPETSYPGYAAALPVLGTALLLVAGACRLKLLTTPLFTNAPIRAIGDWSFSLYLWHWPALILGEQALGRAMTTLETTAAVALVFGLSFLTFRFVETPFRSGRPARVMRVPRALVLYPISLTLVAATCLGSWYWTGVRGGEFGDNPPITATEQSGSLNDEAVALVRASVAAAKGELEIPSDLTPDLLDLRESIADVGACDYTEDVRRLCPRGTVNGSRTLVLIGDSHARAWIPAFDKIIVEGGWTAYYLVKSQCTAAHVTVAPVNEDRPFTECNDFQDWVGDQVEVLDPDLVVVASSPPVNGVYDGSERFESIDKVEPLLSTGYADLFSELLADSARVVLLKDVPKSPGDPGACLTSNNPSLANCMFAPEQRSQILGEVAVASARLTGAEVVDPTPWLCYQGECPIVIGGTLSYRDTDHITTEYAASLSGALGRALDMLEA